MKFKFLKLASAAIILSVCSLANAGIIYSSSAVSSDLRNISSTGTEVFLGDDQVSSDIAIGFDFNFYDILQNSINASSNGFIYLGGSASSSGCCSGGTIPSNDSVNGIVAGFWNDLNGGNLYYQTMGVAGSQEFVFGFYNAPHFGSGGSNTFEIILHEMSNNIEIQFGAVMGNGSYSTVGIENYDGSEGHQHFRSNNSAEILALSNTAVLYTASSTSVPEPTTLAIFALGLIGLASRRFKKQS
jgi:hypothetical protein